MRYRDQNLGRHCRKYAWILPWKEVRKGRDFKIVFEDTGKTFIYLSLKLLKQHKPVYKQIVDSGNGFIEMF